ncbi:MAG: hypothetical protein LBK41_08440 [Clostridiales bacterium]|jgi:hypothetical protein|nr:hypothetical protein [Clostridiales bacterium]
MALELTKKDERELLKVLLNSKIMADMNGTAIVDDMVSDFKEMLIKRFWPMWDSAVWMLVESEYTDSVWSELYSLHYSQTTYAKSNKLFRVHLWGASDNVKKSSLVPANDADDKYIGFVTLRPVPDYDKMLSMVMPNWNVLKLGGETAYVMTYKRKVNINGFTYNTEVAPFYSQEQVYLCCCHSAMLMVSFYMHHKYNTPHTDVTDILSDNIHLVPTEGESYEKILEILTRNRIHVFPFVVDKSVASEDASSKNKLILDVNIESGLPVIVCRNGHALVVFGCTRAANGKPDKYLVYDESGYFVFSILHRNSHFANLLTEKELFDDTIDENGETVKANAVMVVIRYPKVFVNAVNHYGNLSCYLDKQRDTVKKTIGEAGDYKTVLIRNSEAKFRLNSLRVSSKHPFDRHNDKLEKLLESDLTEFVYFSEFCCRDYTLSIVFDPTHPVEGAGIPLRFPGMFIGLSRTPMDRLTEAGKQKNIDTAREIV